MQIAFKEIVCMKCQILLSEWGGGKGMGQWCVLDGGGGEKSAICQVELLYYDFPSPAEPRYTLLLQTV